MDPPNRKASWRARAAPGERACLGLDWAARMARNQTRRKRRPISGSGKNGGSRTLSLWRGKWGGREKTRCTPTNMDGWLCRPSSSSIHRRIGDACQLLVEPWGCREGGEGQASDHCRLQADAESLVHSVQPGAELDLGVGTLSSSPRRLTFPTLFDSVPPLSFKLLPPAVPSDQSESSSASDNPQAAP